VLAIAQPLHRLLDAFVARALALRLAKSDAFSKIGIDARI
jgi:hypothetical protein